MNRESDARSESALGAPPRRRRPLARWLAIAAVLALAILLAWPAGTPEGPMIVVSIDRTLWHRLGLTRFTYLRALRRAGAESRVVNAEGFSEASEPARLARRLLRDADGLLLTGGGDVDPDLYAGDRGLGRGVKEERDRLELALLDEAMRRSLPLLAICRGAQLLNVARGGTLLDMRGDRVRYRRHRRLRRGHAVTLEEGSRLAAILGTTRLETVFTYHGQAVDRVGDGLRVTARAPDGIAEALEAERSAAEDGTPFVVAVQWHPELSPRSREQHRLFEAFVAAARAFRSDAG